MNINYIAHLKTAMLTYVLNKQEISNQINKSTNVIVTSINKKAKSKLKQETNTPKR